MLSLYDESATFLGSLGRYSSGTGAASYDRSIYLSLWGALDSYERDLKSERTRIDNPRLNLSVNGHPTQFINLLRNERFFYDDGLFQRMLCNAPVGPKVYAEDIRNTPQSIVALHCILYFLYVAHFNRNRNYTLTEAARQIFDSKFNLYRDRVEFANAFDSYLGAMCGKTMIQASRIAVAFQALNYACTKLQGIIDANSDELTDEFSEAVSNIITQMSEDGAFVIDVDIMQQAIDCVEYYNMNKLVLSGYNIDTDLSFDQTIEKIFASRPVDHGVKSSLATIDNKIIRLMRNVFKCKFTKINTSRLSSNNCSVAEANEVFKNLEDMGLGKCDSYDANNFHTG